MLQTLRQSSLAPFFPSIAEGIVSAIPQVHFCSVTFEREHYRDEWFAEFAIPFPAFLTRAVTKRRAEYLAGRWCCQRLLGAHQVNGTVEHSAQRAPRWPVGVYGSVSHSENRALVISVRDSSAWRTGVDIERFDRPTMLETAAEITDIRERTLLAQRTEDVALGILLAFSAKESLYKALWPEVEAFFGFDAASLVDVNEGTFTLELNQTLSPSLHAGQRFCGRWQYEAPFITTLVSERR